MGKQCLIAGVALVAILMLSACSGGGAPLGGAEGNAQAALCQGVAAVRSGVVQLGDINAETKLTDVQAASQNLDKLVEALRAANTVLQRPAINDLITQYEGFKQQLSAVANQETLGAAVDGLRQNVTAIDTALDQAKAALSCP